MASSARETSGSRAASSSSGMGRPLANSAASSSFASGVTGDLHGGEGTGLTELQLATLGELEQGEQGREHLPRFGIAVQDVTPPRSGTRRQHRTYDDDRTVHIER